MKITFSIKEALSFGWKTFTARPWLFVSTSLIYLVVQMILGAAQSSIEGMIGALISAAVGSLLSLCFMSFYLKAHDNVQGADYAMLWNPGPFLNYLLASIAMTIAVFAGLVLLIVPGVIIAIALSFSLYLIIEKKMGVLDAFKESARLTKGNRASLFLFGLVLGVINIIGGMFIIPLFITGPVSMLAAIHVYRKLSGNAPMEMKEEKSETAPAPMPAPAPEAAA